jgi:hypothetical protein
MTEEIRTIAIELRKIEDKTGRLTPDAVIAAAKHPKSLLHEYFEWDDSEAARQHRLYQARKLINGVRVEIEINEHTIHSIAYVRDPSVEGDEQGYRAVARLASDEDDARKAVNREFAYAAAALHRARDVAVALGHASAIEGLVRKVVGLGKRISAVMDDAR